MLAFPGSQGRHRAAGLSRVLLVPQFGDRPVPPKSPLSWSMNCPDHPCCGDRLRELVEQRRLQ